MKTTDTKSPSDSDRDYAVLRYSLEEIERLVGPESPAHEIVRDALGVTRATKLPFVTDASIRRYIMGKKSANTSQEPNRQRKTEKTKRDEA